MFNEIREKQLKKSDSIDSNITNFEPSHTLNDKQNEDTIESRENNI
mgnify:CR=1 FL=1